MPLHPAQGGIDVAVGKDWSAEKTHSEALNLLDLLRQGDKADFVAEWSKLSKAQQSAVEKSMVRQEGQYEASQRLAHARQPNYKLDTLDLYDDEKGNLAQIDKKQLTPRQTDTHVPDPSSALVTQSDLTSKPFEAAKPVPPKPVTFDGMTQEDVNAKADTMFKSLRAGTTGINSEFSKDYDALTPSQKAAVGKAIQKQESDLEAKQKDDPNFLKLHIKTNASGAIDSVSMDNPEETEAPSKPGKTIGIGKYKVQIPSKGGGDHVPQEKENTEYLSPAATAAKDAETMAKAKELNGLLREGSGASFASEWKQLSDAQKLIMQDAMKKDEAQFDATHPIADSSRLEYKYDKQGHLQHVELIRPHTSKADKVW